MEVALAFAVNTLLRNLLTAMTNINNSDENLLALKRRLQRLRPLVTDAPDLAAHGTDVDASASNQWLHDLHRELQKADDLVKQAQASRGALYLSGMSGKFQKVDRNISRLLEEAPFVVASRAAAGGGGAQGGDGDDDGVPLEPSHKRLLQRDYCSSEGPDDTIAGPMIHLAERGARRALSGLRMVATDICSIGMYSTGMQA